MALFDLTPKILLIIFVFGTIVLATDEQLPEDEPPLPDYYAVLHVTPDASVKDIRRSFRRLALKYHPDKNPEAGAEAAFKELSEAYAVLNDPEKKQEYDEVLREEMEAARAAEAAAQEEVPSPPEPAPEPTPAGGNTPPEPAAEDRSVPPEPAEEQEEPAASAQQPKGSVKTKDDPLSGLDEETLLRMLQFLASTEFVITKRVSVTVRSEEEVFDNAYHRYKRSTPFDYDRPLRTTPFDYDRLLRTEPLRSDRPLYSEPLWDYVEAPVRSDRSWEQESWRSADPWSSDPWRSSSFSEEAWSACRTSVRWEGEVKVTSTTC